jgi:drug/metabolite transporter (DMT)-like permease
MDPVTGLAAALALVAAVLFAVASAVQQGAAADVPPEQARGVRLLLVLLRRPRWWAGTGSDAAGYAAQAAALGLGSLLLVQPLLVTTLLFALPLSARWAQRPMRRSDWGWAVVLAGALAVFVVSGSPPPGWTGPACGSGCRRPPSSAWSWPRACSAPSSAGGRRGRCSWPWPPVSSTA